MSIKAKKSLGQNFLKDNNVLDKIIRNVEVSSNDLVIEVGPGKGALTKRLKEYNCYVIAFEVDDRLIPILKELEDDKTKVIMKDFLKADLNEHITKEYNKIHVIANIPYYITNPIIRKLIESTISIADITLMVQKEVAERLSSLPGNKSYGALTIFCNMDYEAKKLFDVSKYSFDPVPKVDSSIIQFQKRKNSLNIRDKAKFIKLINNSFQSKRKTLKNNLKGYNWDIIKEKLLGLGYDENVRAEQIKIEDFVELSNLL